MNLRKMFLFAVSAILLASCTSDDIPAAVLPLGDYENGAFILNQGNFGTANASISFLSEGTIYNNVFASVNPTEILGDTGQDMAFYNEYAFIVLNNSQKIEIVNRYTMKHVTSITTGLSNPRSIAFVNGKGYITNWGDGGITTDDYVAEIDLNTFTIINTIPVIEGPEKMAAHNGKLYVAHQGGYGFGNSVSVIDVTTKAVTSILVGDVPNSLFVANNILYVLCGGVPAWSTTVLTSSGSLVKVDLATNTSTTLAFATTAHPSNLINDGNFVYFTEDASIYKMDITAATLPTQSFFSTTAQGVYGVYSFAVNNDKFYIGDAGDYNSNGKVYVYDNAGTLLNNYTVGIIPAGIYFN